MAANFNLKTIFAADTKDLKKGAAEAKQAVKDFDDATTSALDQVAGLFGTSMRDINKTLSSVKGGFMQFGSALGVTTQASGGLSKAMNVLKIALASTGIGLLVVALGSLVAYFTKTQAGSDKLALAMGQLKQVFLVISDAAIAIGRAIVGAFTKTFNFLEGRIKLFKQRAGISDAAKEEEDADKNVFQKRRDLILRQQKLERDEIKWTVERATLEKQIAEQRELAADKAHRTAAERLAANLEAQKLLSELYARQEQFAQERLDLLRLENSLSESKNADLQAEADLEAKLIQLAGQRVDKNKGLLGQEAELSKEVAKQWEAAKKIADLRAQGPLQNVNAGSIKSPMAVVQNKPEIKFERTTYIDDWLAKLGEGVDTAEGYMVDFQKIATDFSDTVTDAFSGMIEGLVSGNLNIQDVFGSILSFLSETLKSIGKALIAYGTAMEAFKTAFTDPWLAIAAGAALVAAGSVLSGLVGKMSSGGSTSVSSNYAAAAISGGSTLDLTSRTQMQSKAQEVKVTGRIVATGRELAVVISNENQRKNFTT